MIPEESILNAKILIVDDNVLNIHVLKKILNSEGFFNITSTTDSLQAVSLYKELHPDLVLLDYNMPNKNGIEVILELALLDSKSYLPVLMLTAEEDNAIKSKALQSGAKDFLRKPYDTVEVILRSRNIIEVRLLYKNILNENFSLEEQIQERTKELRDTRLDVVQRLARVAEYHDKYSGAHIIRMSRYCMALAKSYGLSNFQSELIFATASLHDIGKIAIPDSVLLKPGKLNPEEFDIMKTHTVVGSQILAGSDSVFLKTASVIAQSHHERWDGSGYPHNLKGEDIPLPGRICGLCDVFDALTSERPYKTAWEFKDAVNTILDYKGTHFDPKLVDAFISIKEDIHYIYEIYQ